MNEGETVCCTCEYCEGRMDELERVSYICKRSGENVSIPYAGMIRPDGCPLLVKEG